MAVNYNDERFTQVKNEESAALKETQSTYDSMVNQSDKYYQQQIDASKEWADKQTELQQAQTDFAIEKTEQAKEQAKKDYTKEQKGAYTDYQKATNQYGVNAEQQAAQGLNQTGYSESTRTNAYNTYQNRYMSARESYNQAILNYDNAIKEAQLTNNAALATIAYEALQQQLQLSLQGFQYKNTLLLQKLDAVNQTKDRYYQRYQDVLSQINTENALAEQIRQYNESLAEEKRQYNATLAFQKSQAAQEQANWEKQFALAKSSSGGSGGSAKLTNSRKSSSGSSSSGSSKKSGAVLTDNGGSGGSGKVNTPEVNTAYYQGSLNPDAKNGTFSNGYQPNNVGGKKLSKTGDSLTFTTQTLYGQKQTVTQNIWKTKDGTKYYWDGRYNKYIEIKR